LSPDPVVQFPNNAQNFNRYSYVLNNPLSYMDPSGYFLSGLKKFFKKFWRPILAIVVGFVTAGWAAWYFGIGNAAGATFGATLKLMATGALGAGIGGGAFIGAVGGFFGGLVATGTLKGALTGAITGGIAGAVGGAFGEGGPWADVSDLEFKRALAHGISGGAASEIQGGKFGAGFLSSFSSSLAFHSSFMQKIENPFGMVLAASVIGGTASEIGGGKFQNGAVTSGFQALFNGVMSKSKSAHGRDPDDPRFGGDGGGDFPAIDGESISVLTVDGVTFIKVRAKFILSNGMTFDNESVLNRWELAIEEYWSGTFDGETIRTDLVIDQSSDAAVTMVVTRNSWRPQNGQWSSGMSDWAAAHEFGHILGLDDRYDIWTGVVDPGWEGNIMAEPGGTVWGRDIDKIRSIYER
ncbi:MAG: hypothetical protein AB3N14_10645, partial [Flavobacteriaceae bacterium]